MASLLTFRREMGVLYEDVQHKFELVAESFTLANPRGI